MPSIDRAHLPRHVAIVMDGNGRWAKQRGLKRTEGHAAGEHALFDTVEGALDIGLGWMTVYAFSTENWRRPIDEVRYLMNFNESLLVRRRDEMHDRGVRMRFVGRRDRRVPKRIIRRMDEAAELTRDNRRMTFTIAFNYGGRAEIVDAVRSMVASGMPPSRIDERAARASRMLVKAMSAMESPAWRAPWRAVPCGRPSPWTSTLVAALSGSPRKTFHLL